MPAESSVAPLRGVGVVVTRDEDEDGRLTAALERLGAAVLHWPTIHAAPPVDPAPLRTALALLATYDWLVLTSRRAVEAMGAAARPRLPRVAAVGRATAEAAERVGWRVDVVPDPQTGEALVAALSEAGVGVGTRVLFPASAIARPTVPDGLRALGAEVVRVEAYRIVPAPLDRAACRGSLESGAVRVVTLTSPSAVDHLRTALGPELFGDLAERVVLAAIGPTTGQAARAAGGIRVIESEDHSFEGLVERVVEWSRREDERGAQ